VRSDEALDDVGELLLQAMYNALMAGAEAWARLNLTMPQLKVLMLLGLYGSAPVSWLAARMGVSPPNVTGILDRLEQHGWVQRTNDAHDRRVVRVTLGPDGERLLQELHAAGAEQLRDALGRMQADERAALRTGLHALLRASMVRPAVYA
jgi:DNA-binding MarR family transcriptional regulator